MGTEAFGWVSVCSSILALWLGYQNVIQETTFLLGGWCAEADTYLSNFTYRVFSTFLLPRWLSLIPRLTSSQFIFYASSFQKKKKRIIYFLVLEAETWGHRTVTRRHCRKKKSQDWKILSLCACWAGPSAELILFGSVLSLIYLKNGKQSCIYLTLREVWISTLWNETVHKVWHWGVIPGHPNSTIWSFDHLTALCETHAWSSRSELQVISEKLVFEKLVFSVLSMRWKLFKQERV